MCLAAIALGQSPRFPFVLASNRDEFFERAAEPLQWWPGAAPAILAGRDLDAGGTWLGLSGSGRLALLTNIRNPSEHRDTAASRGVLVPEWLRSEHRFETFWARHDLAAYNGFNLLAFDWGASLADAGSSMTSRSNILSKVAVTNSFVNTPPRLSASVRRPNP